MKTTRVLSRVAAVVLSSCLSVSSPASAQTPTCTSADRDILDALVTRGNNATQKGQHADAWPVWEELSAQANARGCDDYDYALGYAGRMAQLAGECQKALEFYNAFEARATSSEVVSIEKVRGWRGALFEECSARVTVDCDPANASYSIDDSSKRHVCGRASSVKAGMHEVHVRADGHLPKTQSFVVRDFSGARVSVSLERKPKPPATQQLIIACVSAQTLIQIDDKPVGMCPIKRSVSAGAHSIRASKRGHKPQTQSVEIQPGATLQVQFGELVRDEPTRPEPAVVAETPTSRDDDAGARESTSLDPPRTSLKPVSIGLISVGAASVGVGTVLFQLTRREANALALTQTEARSRTRISNGLIFGGAAVGLAGALVLSLASPSSEEGDTTGASARLLVSPTNTSIVVRF